MIRSAEPAPAPAGDRRRGRWAVLALASLMFGAGCGGYALGPSNAQAAGARAIRIGHVANGTDEPRLADTVSHALRAQVHVDGTFRLATRDDGDIVITTALRTFQRNPLTFQARDIIATRRFCPSRSFTAIRWLSACQLRGGSSVPPDTSTGRGAISA